MFAGPLFTSSSFVSSWSKLATMAAESPSSGAFDGSDSFQKLVAEKKRKGGGGSTGAVSLTGGGSTGSVSSTGGGSTGSFDSSTGSGSTGSISSTGGGSTGSFDSSTDSAASIGVLVSSIGGPNDVDSIPPPSPMIGGPPKPVALTPLPKTSTTEVPPAGSGCCLRFSAVRRARCLLPRRKDLLRRHRLLALPGLRRCETDRQADALAGELVFQPRPPCEAAASRA